jgi:hypothetical protein
VDHTVLSINILTLKKQHPAVWRLRNMLLNDKSLIEYMTSIIQYYSALANKEENILDILDKMKRELRLQAKNMKTTKEDRRTNNIKSCNSKSAI